MRHSEGIDVACNKLLHLVDLIDRTGRNGSEIGLQLSSGCLHIAMDPNQQSRARRSNSNRKIDERLIHTVADPDAHHVSRDSDDTHYLIALQTGRNPSAW